MQIRTRNYSSIIYPESAPKNWIEILEGYHVEAIISPLHQYDVNEETGEKKKEHYHLIILFEGCRKIEDAKQIFDSIGGVGVEPIKNIRSYCRYLCHLDCEETKKFRYDIKDVICLSGADYNAMITRSKDKYTAIGEMIEFCMSTNTVSYAKLLLYAQKNRRDWFERLCDGATPVLLSFLRSRTWEMQYEENDEENQE